MSAVTQRGDRDQRLADVPGFDHRLRHSAPLALPAQAHRQDVGRRGHEEHDQRRHGQGEDRLDAEPMASSEHRRTSRAAGDIAGRERLPAVRLRAALAHHQRVLDRRQARASFRAARPRQRSCCLPAACRGPRREPGGEDASACAPADRRTEARYETGGISTREPSSARAETATSARTARARHRAVPARPRSARRARGFAPA